ncbi:hypothetical protein [Streptomyces sp. NPDC050535]|uniref:hypothetical protein n=1 Tax=Streptomyces sp. NPDC050535 TaxID=3365626 RepID=UPI00378B824F
MEWADVRGHQTAETALHVIDQVTIAMDFDSGADPVSVVSQVARFAAVQQPPEGGERIQDALELGARSCPRTALHLITNVALGTPPGPASTARSYL